MTCIGKTLEANTALMLDKLVKDAFLLPNEIDKAVAAARLNTHPVYG